MTEQKASNGSCATPFSDFENADEPVDPIEDIIDYLVRCAKISFKNAHVDEAEVRTSYKIRLARDNFKKSPADFIAQFGKYLAPQHVNYFDNLEPYTDENENRKFRQCVDQLKHYHSDEICRKRTRNRRYKAMQKMQNETDYFSEKEMMYRNPLLYEQLIGQFLTDEEMRQRDNVDHENLTFLNMILETVDRNQMREVKNEQSIMESLEVADLNATKSRCEENGACSNKPARSMWGEFEEPNRKVEHHKPEVRRQTVISAPERRLLREEFLQEMYSSFIEGRDVDMDYYSIDNDEQYDDLQQVSRDAEDKYFDSETNEVENLEQHMDLVKEYGRKSSSESIAEDTLDVFMKHLNNRYVES